MPASRRGPSTLRVQLFALFREVSNGDHLVLSLILPASASDVLDAICRSNPAIGPYRNQAVLAVNRQVVDGEGTICEGDEVALLPPVSGG